MGEAKHAVRGDPPARPGKTIPPVYASEILFRGGSTARISHHGEVYTLRCTRQGKLQLTK